MDIINKYKYLWIIIIIVFTIVGVIVYNIVQNNTEDEYNFEENEVIETIVKKEEKNKIKIHISGEVLNPGVIEIDEGSRIIDAVNLAGGLTEEADLSKINLAYILEDAMKINIPNINDEQEILEEETSGKIMVNINTANVEELQKISGIGLSTAQKIVQYRKEHGKFTEIEEIKNVTGVGESKFEKIKNNIYVK